LPEVVRLYAVVVATWLLQIEQLPDGERKDMARSKRIGLREVRALQPNEIAWDTAVSGFGARRQRDAVTYVLKYRTTGAASTPRNGSGRAPPRYRRIGFAPNPSDELVIAAEGATPLKRKIPAEGV
jgi:hypothetical protein